MSSHCSGVSPSLSIITLFLQTPSPAFDSMRVSEPLILDAGNSSEAVPAVVVVGDSVSPASDAAFSL